MDEPGRDRRPQGERAAGAAHPRPAGGLQGEPDPLAQHQDRPLRGTGADRRAPAHRRARARDPRVQAAGVLEHRGAVRQGRADLRGLARQGRRPQAAAPFGGRGAGRGGRGARSCRSSSPRSRSATGGRIPARRSPPARCSRRPPRSSASAPGAPCARRRTSTRAWTSGEDGPVGLITYMRTDSVRVSDTAIASVRDFIGKQLQQAVSARDAQRLQHPEERPGAGRPRGHPPDRRAPAPRAGAAVSRAGPVPALPAHLAALRRLADDAGGLRHDDRRLRSRPVPLPGHRLGARVRRLPRALHRGPREGGRARRWTISRPFRRSSVGDRVEVREITPSQHFTEPPPRFSEASLVKELERLGIGRPSTYSAIISTLSAREYVKVEQRRFFPTELGELVEKIMVAKFPEIFNVEFTSEMEDELDRIEEGELGWQRVLKDFYGPFSKALDAVDLNALVAEAHGLKPEDLAKERCPKCGSPIELKTGRFGPVPRMRQVQGHLRLREVAQEGTRARPAHRREVPSVRLAHGHQDRAVRRVPGLHHVPGVQGHPRHPARDQVPQVSRGRPRRAAHQAGQVVLGLRALSRVRLLQLEPAGAGHLPDVRLGRDGEEDQQGGGRDAGPASSAATSWSWPSPRRWRWRERHRRRRRSRRLGGGLGARGARRPGDPVRDAPARADAGASHRSAGRAGLQQLLQVHRSHQRPRPAQGRAARAGQPAAPVRRSRAGARRHGAGGGPRGVLAGSARAGHRPPQHPRRCAEEVAELPSPGIVATGPLTSDRLAEAIGGAARRRPRWRSTTRSRRSCRATRSTTSGSTRSPATARATGDDYLNAPLDARRLRGASSTRWSRPTSTRATTSTRCRTSRAACRSRRWRGAGARRCGSGR